MTDMHERKTRFFKVSCLTTLDKKSEMHIITIRQYIHKDLVPLTDQ